MGMAVRTQKPTDFKLPPPVIEAHGPLRAEGVKAFEALDGMVNFE
jgi:hypothetical protein